jgi:peptidoglycan/LPS O-acetylase OafA/YrhL
MLVAQWVEWRTHKQGRVAPVGPEVTAVLMALGLALVVANGYWHETADPFSSTRLLFGNLPAAVGLALVLTAAAVGAGPVIGWLSARPLPQLGLISYGIYLWHLPLILTLRRLGLLPAAFAPRLVLVLLLAVGAGTLSWILVERPLIRLVAARQNRTRTPRRRVSTSVLAEA